MSYTEINAKHVKGRKEYRCEWCYEPIKKAEIHFVRSYEFNGDVYLSERMHQECKTAMDKSDHDVLSTEGFYPGDNKRGIEMIL